MFSRDVRELMDHERAILLSPGTTVLAAARMMAERKYGAVMVVEHGRLVGIFTERDALFRVVAPGLEPLVRPPYPRSTANTYWPEAFSFETYAL